MPKRESEGIEDCKSGAWFSYNGDKIGQGKENAKNYLEQNEELYKEVEEKVKQAMNNEE